MGAGGYNESEKPGTRDSQSSDVGDIWMGKMETDREVSRTPTMKEYDDKEKHDKYFRTGCLCMAFLVLGMCLALIGPALPTLADNLGIEESRIYFILTARGFGYFFGSLLCGFLLKRMTPSSLIVICLIINAVAHIISPFSPNALLLGVILVIAGAAMGSLETSANVSCLSIWGHESEIWMQTTHFFLSAGCIIAPIIAKSFIHEPVEHVKHPNMTGYSSRFSLVDETRNNSLTTFIQMHEFPRVAWLFIIAAFLSCLSAGLYGMLHFAGHEDYQQLKRKALYTEEKTFRLKVISLLFVFFLLNAGCEMTFGFYIYSYAIHCRGHYRKEMGVLLNTVFTSTFAFGCFVSILIAKRVSPEVMLVMDLVGTAIATLGLSLFPLYWEFADWILWFSTGLYGLSMANVFPAGITWAENFISVNGSAASAFVVGCSLGEMLVPFCVGILFKMDPNNLMVFCFAANSLSAVIFVLVQKLAKNQSEILFKQEQVSLLSIGSN